MSTSSPASFSWEFAGSSPKLASRVGPLSPGAGSTMGRSAGDGGGMSSGGAPTTLCLNSGHGTPDV
eukprot:12489288-Alexandrium_andersonii.AAC.1